MPCNYKDYHPDWHWISRQIRDQADNRCEFCGLENRTWVWRHRRTGKRLGLEEAVEFGERERKFTLVVLTVAHLDHDRANNDPANLKALCQQCHLRWDAEHHAKNAAETRRQKRIAAGQGVMTL